MAVISLFSLRNALGRSEGIRRHAPRRSPVTLVT